MDNFDLDRIEEMIEAFRLFVSTEKTDNMPYSEVLQMVCQVAIPDATLEEAEYAYDLYMEEVGEFLSMFNRTHRARLELH